MFRNQVSLFCRKYHTTSHKCSNVLIFGDSNTWGYSPKPRLVPRRIPDGQRWTDHLANKLPSASVTIDALNARTTIFTDPASPCDGEYNCNGRDMFMTALHTHKPLDVVVIALGTNDLKTQFSNTAHSIAAGVRILARDVQRATNIGRVPNDTNGEKLVGPSPEIIILGVPLVVETPSSLAWGFHNCGTTCKNLVPLLRDVAKSVNGTFINIQDVAKVSKYDGVHFDAAVQMDIANAVSEAVAKAIERRNNR